MADLFDSMSLRGITTRNRIWLAPMCQYSVDAQDGVPTDWHLVHLGARASGGFGLVFTEATSVSPVGRISPQDTGIWSEDQAAAWEPITRFIRDRGAVPAIQLAHAGRKASTTQPWEGRVYAAPEIGGWDSIGPSALAYDRLPAPTAMTTPQIEQLIKDFAAGAARAVAAGFGAVEVHGAHGYVLHQFLSPLSNKRSDEYGGVFANRVRLIVRVVAAVRASVPDAVPVFVRLSATDWVDGGWSVDETVQLAMLLKEQGADLIDLTSGGADPRQQIPIGPSYQVPFARTVRAEADIPTAAVGLIAEAKQAQDIVGSGDADAVLLGRAALRDPAWPLRAAFELGLDASKSPYPVQYEAGAFRA